MPVLILSRDDHHWKMRRFDAVGRRWQAAATDLSASVAAVEALRRTALEHPDDLVAVSSPEQPSERTA